MIYFTRIIIIIIIIIIKIIRNLYNAIMPLGGYRGISDPNTVIDDVISYHAQNS